MESTSRLRRTHELLIGLTTFCGIIQITLLLLVKPLGYWIFPIGTLVVFLLGYKGKIVNPIKRKKDKIKFMVVLLMINLVFFAFIGVTYYYDPTDKFSLDSALIVAMLWTMMDFQYLGMYLAKYRKKEEST